MATLIGAKGKLTPQLVDILKARLDGMNSSPAVVVLSPFGGMKGQVDKPFGRQLYGITKAAMAVAELADKTFSNFSEKKLEPNKSD